MTNPTATMTDSRALGAPAVDTYHGAGAATRDRADHTHPGLQEAGHNEKGLQP